MILTDEISDNAIADKHHLTKFYELVWNNNNKKLFVL